MAAARRDRLDTAIQEMAADSEYTAVVRRLCCLRGVSTLTGFALAVEVGDWYRFTGSTIGAYLGLVPTERSSGQSRSQGSITKTGNTHARRLLVEAAWHHRKPYRTPGLTMQARWAAATPAAQGPRPPGQPTVEAIGGRSTPPARKGQSSRTSRSPASWPAGAGRWPPSSTRSNNTNPQDRRAAVRGVAARGANSRLGYEQQRFSLPRSPSRQAETLQPNSPSCGIQPANISLTAPSPRHARDLGRRPAPIRNKNPPRRKPWRYFLLPT